MIKNYHDLEVWQLGRQLVKAVYTISDTFPAREQYGLTSQIRRAIVSVPSNIAEGHSRHSTRDYVQYVSIAIGSLAEVETQLILAQDMDYVTTSLIEPTISDIHRLQRMLHSLRTKLKANPRP